MYLYIYIYNFFWLYMHIFAESIVSILLCTGIPGNRLNLLPGAQPEQARDVTSLKELDMKRMLL